MADSKQTAKCLCGAVTVHAIPNPSLGACHCATCRTWGGGPFMTTEASEVSFEGESKIGVFVSSDWAERGFCQGCGTHLFYRLREHPVYHLPAGLFADTGYRFDHEVFIDQRPDYYAFANQTKQMTGEEMFAAFAPSDD